MPVSFPLSFCLLVVSLQRTSAQYSNISPAHLPAPFQITPASLFFPSACAPGNADSRVGIGVGPVGVGVQNCLNCVPGRHAPKKAAKDCDNCPAGHWSGQAAIECTKCANGKFAKIEGSAECLPCSAYSPVSFSFSSTTLCFPPRVFSSSLNSFARHSSLKRSKKEKKKPSSDPYASLPPADGRYPFLLRQFEAPHD